MTLDDAKQASRFAEAEDRLLESLQRNVALVNRVANLESAKPVVFENARKILQR